jgi:tetratricopeptide (TPR) repeat protein
MAIPLYEQANKLNEEGKFEEALDLYDQLLTQNPDHPILLAAVATILMRNTKTLGMAIALFRKSLDKAKGKPATEVYSNLGLAYKYSGQPALALEYMKKAIDTEPTAGTLTNYGSMFVESDRPEEGKKHLERAISMEPRSRLRTGTYRSACYRRRTPPTAGRGHGKSTNTASTRAACAW